MSKIDANVVSLRYAEEDSFKTVSGDEIWYQLDPNEFSDFGPEFTKIARRPFRDDRQERKGTTSGLNVPGGFQSDLVQEGLQDLLQGFFYADLRKKSEVVNDAGTEITGVTDVNNRIAGPSLDTTFPVGTLVQLSGFGVSANNVHIAEVTAVASGTIDVDADLLDEGSPPTTSGGVEGAKIVEVGFEFTAGDLDVDISGDFATYTTATKDLTQLGLIPGEWIFVGGDVSGAAGDQFLNAANNGWKRVRSVTANALVVDKSDAALITEASTAETVRIFYGRVLKNESDSTLIQRRTYQLERTLGAPAAGSPTEIQADYITGATPATLQLNFPTEEKVTVDLTFVGGGYERIAAAAAPNTKSALAAAGSGGAPANVEEDPFNTAADYSRINIHVVSSASEAPTPLFTNIETWTLTVDNNVNPNKAQGVLGTCGNSLGLFSMSGNLTGYFEDVASIGAMADNDDVSMDAVFVKGATGFKTGLAVDLPLIALGDGKPDLALDQKIKLPLTMQGATAAKILSTMNHTLLVVFYDALPNAAVVTIS